ncbi:hypothetical protein [Nostoc sp.]|uniref:hypothetical protein n=1 Tax=Nostoc sp. TaxID=1180 RepID=UPI002FF8B989
MSSFKHLIILTGDSTILTTKERSLTLEEYFTYSDRTGNRYELVDVSFLVVRGDTNQNNERITNNHSHI